MRFVYTHDKVKTITAFTLSPNRKYFACVEQGEGSEQQVGGRGRAVSSKWVGGVGGCRSVGVCVEQGVCGPLPPSSKWVGGAR